jgi:two-component system phosphate regulon response regulator PhoB
MTSGGMPMQKKILVVEDNSDLLELLSVHLREARYHVATASDGFQALKVAHRFKPDLVLLDLVLPELDGFAVCERLRRNPATAQTPIIILTGLTSEITRFAGMESGGTDYVLKPASIGQILAKVEQWVGARCAQDGEEPPTKRKLAGDCCR